MLGFILTTSILNVLLGAALAIVLRPRAKSPRRKKGGSDAAEASVSSVVENAGPPSPPKFVIEDLSPEWVEKLVAESVQARSLVEASSQVLRLEVGRYRESLVSWEYKIRAIPKERFASSIRGPIAEIVRINEEWLTIQNEAVKLISSKSSELDYFRELSTRLEEILLGQTSQIESMGNNLLQLRTTDPPDHLREVILRELQRLIDLAHRLRDAIHDTLLAIFTAENRVERAETKLKIDAQTQLLSPIGLEGAFEQWKQAGAAGHKPACLALIGLDQFKNLNELLGTRHADALLTAAAKVCAETIRKDRGFDRIARLQGDTLAIFYGDVSIRSSVSAVERVRQTLMQSAFLLDGRKIELRATCAIAAQLRAEPLSSVMQRAAAALRYAKAKSRDRIVIEEGSGPAAIDGPELKVQPAKITLPTVTAWSD
jgi:diguanylate cyclase